MQPNHRVVEPQEPLAARTDRSQRCGVLQACLCLITLTACGDTQSHTEPRAVEVGQLSEDAIEVLLQGINLFPEQVTSLEEAQAELATAEAAADPAVRLSATRSALNKVQTARAMLGTDLDFELGEANLMF